MIRTVAVVAALSFALLAGGAAAQTWGQPIYVSPSGRIVGGAPLSEVETRPYVATGRWADGYADQAHVYVPAPVYDARSGHGYGYGYGYDRLRRGYHHGHGRTAPRPRAGYRDVWGYNDDRPPSARHGRRDRDCGCGDVYLYDR